MANRFMLVTAPKLFQLAKDAYQRTKAAPSDREPKQWDALAAVLFSAAALEAFINEIESLAEPVEHFPSPPRTVTKFLEGARKLHRTRGETEAKYLLAAQTLGRRPYDKGGRVYEDFKYLFDLRNEILHRRPQEEFGTTTPSQLSYGKAFERLRSRNILADHHSDKRLLDALDIIATRAVAKWACETAVRMVEPILLVTTRKRHFRVHMRHYKEVFILE